MTQLHANQAVTKPASGADVQPHVGFRVPMAVLAVCACILLSGGGFAASFSDSNASLQVHRTRHGLQMPGVNAAVNAAQMVEIQTVRYGSKEVLPGFAMSQLGDCATRRLLNYRHAPVASRVKLASPQPATSFPVDADIAPDTLINVFAWTSHGPDYRLNVRRAMERGVQYS